MELKDKGYGNWLKRIWKLMLFLLLIFLARNILVFYREKILNDNNVDLKLKDWVLFI